jgi:hypothetical protein
MAHWRGQSAMADSRTREPDASSAQLRIEQSDSVGLLKRLGNAACVELVLHDRLVVCQRTKLEYVAIIQTLTR